MHSPVETWRCHISNIEVDQHNQAELQALDGPLYTFERTVQYTSQTTKILVDQFKNSLPIGQTLKLKIGALVMLRQNFNNIIPNMSLFNGDIGRVTGFGSNNMPNIYFKRLNIEVEVRPHIWHCYGPENDDVAIGSVRMLPLTLAYAMTVHKSQGNWLHIQVNIQVINVD